MAVDSTSISSMMQGLNHATVECCKALIEQKLDDIEKKMGDSRLLGLMKRLERLESRI